MMTMAMTITIMMMIGKKQHCLSSVEFANYCQLLEAILYNRKREEEE